jgi:hypothetical protein
MIIQLAEKLHELVEKAPAGGVFHDMEISDVAGVEVPGFGGAAGFTLTSDTGVSYRVGIVEES